MIYSGCYRNCITVFGQNSQVCGSIISIRIEAGVVRHVVLCLVILYQLT